MDPREQNLPKWAQEMLKNLREKLDTATEPLRSRVAVLEARNHKLKSRNEALIELLECAAKGGHETAVEICKMIEVYELSKPI